VSAIKPSFVIPAYNEEDRIETTLKEYIDELLQIYPEAEFLVVTDGCSDNTPEIVDRLSGQHSCIMHIHPEKRLGKGGAIIKGFHAANGDVIGFLDGDGSVAAGDIRRLIDGLCSYDGIIASRWIKGSTILRPEPLARIIASRAFNLLVRALFSLPFKDTQCGAKFFRRYPILEVIDEIGLTNWSFDIELLYRLRDHGYRIEEIPVTWIYKEGSKLKLKSTSLKMFVSVIGLRIKTSRIWPFIPKKLVDVIYKTMKY
jgi:glycosyltransferase involved in cell wall biosynthesis